MNRGKILYRCLKKHINEDDVILDYCCGVSEIAKYLIGKHNYIGFDYDEDIISKVKKKYKKGRFELKNYVDIDYEADVLMFFRSSYMDHPTQYLKRNIGKMKPRLVFLDTCLRKRQVGELFIYRHENGLTENYTRLNLFLLKMGYKVIEKGTIGKDYYYYQLWRLNETK